MASNDTGHGGSMAISFTTVAALLAVLGGLLLVTRQLSSDRPLAKPGIALQAVGDQKVEARLWEDPFSPWEKLTSEQRENWEEVGMQKLRDQLKFKRTSCGDDDQELLVMPVMVPSGSYSESRESRVRSRFAVVSALGQSGFVPEDPERLGALRIPWEGQSNLVKASISPIGSQYSFHWPQGGVVKDGQAIWVSYEWYRPRVFYPEPDGQKRPLAVLVMWVPEDALAGSTLLRLAQLIHPLVDCHPETRAAVIGPVSSHMLRAMVGGKYAAKPSIKIVPCIAKLMKRTFERVSLFLATPNAMDEVLGSGSAAGRPRQELCEQLKAQRGFHSVKNFAATDAQLASEVMDELRLRTVDLTDPKQHLVLVSEWDSFYGRMLSLTYAAELAVRQKWANSREDFITTYRMGDLSVRPENLHPFVYQRGLDGQISSTDASGKVTPEERWAKEKLASLEDLKRWMPDGNRAEGPAQFDYLSRLGDHLEKLDCDLRQNRKGTVRAVGIVGGDTYDTLLILQALRSRFPNTLFFTTELDARLWNPSEWEWSRNLIVVSGYGLQLNEQLQRQVPAFRSSTQTAQFAATLAAFGDPKLAGLTRVPVRRFEIGRHGGVDLSVEPGGVLQPPPLWQTSRCWGPGGLAVPLLLGLVVLVAIVTLMTLMYRPWRALTWERSQHLAESLWLREEDIGGVDGYRLIAKKIIPILSGKIARLRKAQIAWIRVNRWFGSWWPSRRTAKPTRPPSGGDIHKNMEAFLDKINHKLRRHEFNDDTVLSYVPPMDAKVVNAVKVVKGRTEREEPFLPRLSFFTLRSQREVVDHLLDKLQGAKSFSPTAEVTDFTVADAASSARIAGIGLFESRRRQARGFAWGSAVLLLIGLILLAACLRDTYGHAGGEPFSLVSGVSAWPAVWLRTLSTALAGIFIVRSYAGLKETTLQITRSYRLPSGREDIRYRITLPTTPIPLTSVNAGDLWRKYRAMGDWKHRLWRVVPMVVVYGVLGLALMQMAPLPLPPVRGAVVDRWETLSLIAAVISFLVLTFGTLDATRLCRWLIEQLSGSPTLYPASTREHFQRLRGGLEDVKVLNEWIDLRLIAELSERVGRLIYYPFIVFFVLLLSRNAWWDHWSWSLPLMVIFCLNLVFAVTAALILQKTAHTARQIGLERLQKKINKLRSDKPKTPPQKADYTIEQLNDLVTEIRDLKTGAFGSFWQSPVLGALLVPSGGTLALQLISYLMGR